MDASLITPYPDDETYTNAPTTIPRKHLKIYHKRSMTLVRMIRNPTQIFGARRRMGRTDVPRKEDAIGKGMRESQGKVKARFTYLVGARIGDSAPGRTGIVSIEVVVVTPRDTQPVDMAIHKFEQD